MDATTQKADISPLKAARKARKLTQLKVAELIGVTSSSVTQWETGKTVPTDENLLRLAEVYGLTVEEIAAMLPAGDAAVFRVVADRVPDGFDKAAALPLPIQEHLAILSDLAQEDLEMVLRLAKRLHQPKTRR